MKDIKQEIERLKEVNRELMGALEKTLNWLYSFSTPPTSTIKEKEGAISILESAMEKTRGEINIMDDKKINDGGPIFGFSSYLNAGIVESIASLIEKTYEFDAMLKEREG